MDKKKKILSPEFLKIDDRSISDLINYIGNLSKEIIYYDTEDNISGTFFEMFSYDESFLISEISKFDTEELKSKRIKLIKQFDHDLNTNKRQKILFQYLDFTKFLFDTLNDWFMRSTAKKLNLSNSELNEQIESIISHHASSLLKDFNLIILKIKALGLNKKYNFENVKYKFSIWESNTSQSSEIQLEKDNDLNIEILFKKLILINNSLFKLISNVVNRSSEKLTSALNKKNHNAHIGLLFAFLNLFKHLQNDINRIGKKHLDYYFSKVLMQKTIQTAANKTFAVFSIDQNISETLVNKNAIINSGQYENGSVIKYKVDNDIILNNAKISFLMTVFLSRNSLYEFKSNYRLISSVFSKIICNNITEVSKFNASSKVFNALGIDQNLFIEDETNMDYADIGFILGSSALNLGKAKRHILIDFVFDDYSLRQLSNLIIDISNQTELNEDEVFFKVFSNSFEISYTTEIGWEMIENYEILMPDDWSSNTLSIKINLLKSKPAFHKFNSSLHNENINGNSPMIKFRVNQRKFYNVFAFLDKMKFEQIRIKTSVFNLKDLKVFRDGQSIQNSNEYEIFGSTPKYNSALFVGCEELFNKKIIDFKISWKYSNLDEIEYNLREYYNGYGKDFSHELFKIKLSLLSDFNYILSEEKQNHFPVFDIEEDKILNKKTHYFNLTRTNISPNFDLDNNYINEFSNDYQTGLFKLELDSPTYAFGHRIYPKVYAENITSNLSQKEPDLGNNTINEPFSPKISEISIDYSAESILYFNEKNRQENDFSENNSFYHISPYGIKRTFSKENINKFMFENIVNEGELIIGFQSYEGIRNIDLLFEIVKNENESYDFSTKIEWFYSSKGEWKKLTNQNILNDQTNSLLNSGVISFLLPFDYSSSKYLLNIKEFYIKAISKNRADQFGLIKSIHTNSSSVTEIIPKDNNIRLSQLKAGSLQDLEKKINGVISISQPIDSPKISLSENQDQYYKRVSNLLKHKKRPVTSSDFEQFLLSSFNYLSYVKCVNSSESEIALVCLKRIEKHQHIDEMKLSSSEIKEITNFLKSYISPHFTFKIISPIFEDMWIKCSILFRDLNPGRGIELINKELLDFICPWKNSNYIDKINLKINNIDILNFLKSRSYIKYITGFSVIHFKSNLDGEISIYDSAAENYDNDFIQAGCNRSIIVSRNIHKIKVLEFMDYETPQKVNFEDLEMNKSFVAEKSISYENKKANNDSALDEFDNLQFIIK